MSLEARGRKRKRGRGCVGDWTMRLKEHINFWKKNHLKTLIEEGISFGRVPYYARAARKCNNNICVCEENICVCTDTENDEMDTGSTGMYSDGRDMVDSEVNTLKPNVVPSVVERMDELEFVDKSADDNKVLKEEVIREIDRMDTTSVNENSVENDSVMVDMDQKERPVVKKQRLMNDFWESVVRMKKDPNLTKTMNKLDANSISIKKTKTPKKTKIKNQNLKAETAFLRNMGFLKKNGSC